MKMPTSLRLDKETEDLLKETAEALRTSKTEVIRRSLVEYCSRIKKRQRPYELIKDLLDRAGSGRGDLSIRSEEILREKLRRK